MPGTLHFARNDPEIAERRTQTRTLVTPPIYANIESLNGGLVYNMSEEGLALSAAMNLRGDGLLGMQIHLPDSRDPVEAKGLVAWRSGSGRTVGIKLVSLSEEARLRIRNWLASENLQSEPRSEGEELPRLEQHPAIGSAKTALFPLPNPMDSSAAEDLASEQINSIDSPLLVDQSVGVVTHPVPQPTQIAPDSLVSGDSSAQPGERRAYPRCPIRPFSYVELGHDNGGVLLNISESGLAVTSAMALAEKDLPSIVVQFTGSQDQVNVSGQIAWISESKKEAGIRFVNLTEEARRIIAGRISKEQSPAEDQVQSVKVPDPAIHAPKPKIARLKIPKPVDFPNAVSIPPAIPEIPKLKILKPAADTPSGAAAQEDRRASILTNLSLPDDFVQVAPESVSGGLSQKSEFRRKSRPLFRPGTLRAVSDQLRRLAAVLVLAAVAGLAIRWVVASPSIRHEVVGFIAENTKSLNKPVELKEALPTNKANKIADASVPQPERGSQAVEFDPAPTNRDGNGSGTALAPAPPPARIGERSAARLVANSTPRHTESSLSPVKSQLTKLPDHAVAVVPNPAAANARSQSVASSPVQQAQNTLIPVPSLSTSIPSGTGLTEVKEKEPPPPPKQPVVQVVPTWSVSVSTDPYPSIRIPPDVSSQKATRGSSLQIGRATSRVEPVYPEEAKRQGVEGTVKLHVVVNRDGTVQSAEPISGPTLLAKAATSAIREWHYAQTLLAGQPVETEQDIVVNFRLVNPSVAKN